MAQFNDIITTQEQFRKIMGDPSELVTRKTLSSLDKHCATFINRSPFAIISSVDVSGKWMSRLKATLRVS